LAERVQKTGKPVELEPMNPYERRIIHSSLQEYEDIKTFSEGEEPYRKVIISHV
jgi:spoIIIJ-associated protein